MDAQSRHAEGSSGSAGRLEPAAFGPVRERWIVAVHLGCIHCRSRLDQLASAGTPKGVSLEALVVDTPTRPTATALDAYPLDAVWWDARAIWRHRWGHRIYGEVLVFDATGRHLETVPPGASPASRGAGYGVPPDDR